MSWKWTTSAVTSKLPIVDVHFVGEIELFLNSSSGHSIKSDYVLISGVFHLPSNLHDQLELKKILPIKEVSFNLFENM